MRILPTVALALVAGAASPSFAQDGPVVITGTVESNTLQFGRFAGAQPGDPVRMTFSTLAGGFNPFWGPTGRFVNIDEPTFEMYVGQPGSESVCFSAASNTSILFVNAGYVTPAVSQDEMEFFQMRLDSSMYRVYFKVSDYDDSVWSSPLLFQLPHRTPAAPFDFKRWEVSDLANPDMLPAAPIMVINFDGEIVVPCLGDFNDDGAATVQDIFDFLTAWFANNASADINRDTSVSVQDIFDFLTAWFRGC